MEYLHCCCCVQLLSAVFFVCVVFFINLHQVYGALDMEATRGKRMRSATHFHIVSKSMMEHNERFFFIYTRHCRVKVLVAAIFKPLCLKMMVGGEAVHFFVLN